jgi:hypothetical protein
MSDYSRRDKIKILLTDYFNETDFSSEGAGTITHIFEYVSSRTEAKRADILYLISFMCIHKEAVRIRHGVYAPPKPDK